MSETFYKELSIVLGLIIAILFILSVCAPYAMADFWQMIRNLFT